MIGGVMTPPHRYIWLFVAFSCFCVAVASPSPAFAYCRSTTCSGDCPRDLDNCKISGHPLYWPGLCVGFSLNKAGSEHIDFAAFREVVHRGFVAWSELDCGDGPATLAFTELGTVACHRAEYNPDLSNANIILFQDHKWSYTGPDNTLAKTTVTYDVDSGEIFDADIELNHAYNEFTIADQDVVYDLQSIVTHEIGHFIGLDHTPDYIATMYAAYEKGTIGLRTLEIDDEEGLCAAYPASRPVACDPTPKGQFASQCGQDQLEPAVSCAAGGMWRGARGQRASGRANMDAPWALLLGALSTIVWTARRRARASRASASERPTGPGETKP